MKQTIRSLLSVLLTFALISGCGTRPRDEYRVVEEIDTVEKKEDPKKENKEPVSESPVTPTPEMVTTEAKSESKPSNKTETKDSGLKEPITDSVPAESKSSPVAKMESPPQPTPSPEIPPSAETAATPAMPANMPASPDAPVIPTGPLPIKLLIPQKEFTAEGSAKALRVTFDDIDLLKVLNMEPVPEDAVDHFPEWLSSLNGKKIVLRGWMYPPARQDGISRFMFVRDNGICCFGRAPKIYDKLGVTLRKGVTTPYIQNRPFDVVGTLLIEPEIDSMDEGQSWLYFLEDAIVIDSARS
ncbi:MAG TPA: hypothetical protein VNQ76_16050 [Planctomicrobium sp.]|nr:hypothetical protein [Planctomicrobium sp.]